MNYWQQGDCLLKVTEKFPFGGTPVASDLLFKGTQHHHRLRGEFVQTDDSSGTRFVKVGEGGAELFHEEHRTIKIPPGEYRLDFVQEYDHFLEESRQVID